MKIEDVEIGMSVKIRNSIIHKEYKVTEIKDNQNVRLQVYQDGIVDPVDVGIYVAGYLEPWADEKKTLSQRITEGLQIILKYDSNGDVWHDLVEYLHAGGDFMTENASPEDNERLNKLGWKPHYNGGWEFCTLI